jgi:hypothetical protein
MVYPMDVKFLGVFVTEDLSWTTHTQYVCRRLSETIYLIKYLRDSVSQTVLINVCHAKFKSVLKYGIIFWGGVQKDFETVFKLQKKCIRVIKGVKNRVSCRNLFCVLKILTGTSLYIFEILCLIKKIRFILPSILMSMVTIPFIDIICMYNFVKLSVAKEGWLVWEQNYLMALQLN